MTHLDHLPQLDQRITNILADRHLAILATIEPDGRPQMSVIFVVADGGDLVFSTILGRRKTSNMQRDARVILVLHSLERNTWTSIFGTVELVDDLNGTFHQTMYGTYMDGATPPPEPGAHRVIVQLTPVRIYVQPPYDA